LIAHVLIKHFAKGEKPLTAQQISHSLEIPVRLVRQILFELVHSNIMSEVKTVNEKELAYQPAFDIHRLTLAHVLEALDQEGGWEYPGSPVQGIRRVVGSIRGY